MLSGALTLCAMLVGCAETSPSQASESSQSSQSSDEIQSPLGLPTQCDPFCKQAEGPGWRGGGAGSEQQCEQRDGIWFPSGPFYMGPPPGCCCTCGLKPPLECA
ncbi:MAG TPA: hypothetical protein VHT91_20390 [Kofleriaceae bacterium]|nr:hypothetical protein [Kofleriaceae bacterium]